MQQRIDRIYPRQSYAGITPMNVGNPLEPKMTYYSILAVTPTDESWIPDYLPTANALVAQHGGQYLSRTSEHEQLEGEPEKAALRILIAWPSKEAAQAFMNDPAYAPHLKARTAGSISSHHLLAGQDDLA